MNKKRKSFDDSLASEFVFGGDKPQTAASSEVTTIDLKSTNIAPMSEKIVENKSKELSLMEKLQVEAKEGTKHFTIDLRESVHRKLSILSAKTGRSKADIIRMVLDDVLKDVEE